MADIGIDSRMVDHSGIGTYLRGLLRSLEQGRGGLDAFSLHGGEDFSFLSQSWTQQRFTPEIYSIREQLAYGAQLKKCKLWHAIHYNVPYFRGSTKLVVTIHDIIHWIFRKEFLSPTKQMYAGMMLRRAVNHSNHIITVSEATKRDLIKYFSAPEEKITVTYEGVSDYFQKVDDQACDEVLKPYNLSESYFLYVGLIKPHKNVQWLIENYLKLKEQKKIPEELVIVGKSDSAYPKGYELLGKLGNLSGVRYIPYATKEELRGLYNKATALIHPSLYEGFGLTPLESMACETPVIASNAASLPEVVGDAGMLVDPKSSEQLQASMIELSENSDFRAESVSRGLEQVKRFSWDKMAEETMQVYERVLGRS